MPQQNQISLSDSKLAESISRFEKMLVQNPTDMRFSKNLLMLLDCQSPRTDGNGQYSRCQRALAASVHYSELTGAELTQQRLIEILKGWWQLSDEFNVNKCVAIAQAVVGKKMEINDVSTRCADHLTFFKEKNAINKICFSCFKVQILTQDFLSLIRLYFIMSKMELPRDNARKCMIELREEFAYPYKGYIYCESEEEAIEIMHQLKSEMLEFGLNGVYCAISHGCSEYGLAYPKFKYSTDGAHRSFDQPDEWEKLETESITIARKSDIERFHFNSSDLTLRDVICFETWLTYAEIIGDPSCLYFSSVTLSRKPDAFIKRVKNQAVARKAQLDELQKRQYAE